MPNRNPRKIGDLPYPNRSATTNVELNVGGILTAPAPSVAGSGYAVGEQLTVAAPPSGGIQAVIEIATVDGSGGILTLKIVKPGAGYTSAPTPSDPAVTSGSGATYTATTLMSIVPVFLGRIYTTDATGRLIDPPTAASVVNLTNGILQARATTVTGDGFTKVQVVTPPTRILLKDKAGGLKINDKVQLGVLNATTPDQEAVVIGVTSFDTAHVGRIFEIDTKNTNGSKKLVSEAGDLLVIDMGVAQ